MSLKARQYRFRACWRCYDSAARSRVLAEARHRAFQRLSRDWVIEGLEGSSSRFRPVTAVPLPPSSLGVIEIFVFLQNGGAECNFTGAETASLRHAPAAEENVVEAEPHLVRWRDRQVV